MAGTFSVSGLASGMDTASIVDKLVQLESQPLTNIATQQSGLKTQLSLIGQIISKLTALKSAAEDLDTNGVLAAKSSSENTAFTAAPGSSTVAGRYAVQVLALAKAAKFQSAAFASADTVAAGTFTLTVPDHDPYSVVIPDGTSLEDAAFLIRQSGAPVSAVVLNDGTNRYLSVTARDTGYPTTGVAADALGITFTPTGTSTNKLPALTQVQAAVNASVKVDNITFSRRTNTISDAIPGTTLTLKKEGGAAEDLVVSTDADGTKARLQKFVDAYNAVTAIVQKQLTPDKDTDRTKTLAGDSTVRTLQAKLQALVATSVGSSGDVRTLADVGVKTAKDGSLSVDSTVLTKALERNPAAVNALFSTKDTGLADVVGALVTAQTRSGDGLLVNRQAGINRTITSLDEQAARIQLHIDSFRLTLEKQFAAMENTVSNLKSMGTFLTSMSSSSSK
ncbi:MAG: flagellar filament capping protein FliD [Anaeromyxobacter sp.]